MTTTYTVNGSAIDAYGCIACAYAGTGSTHQVTGYVVNAYGIGACPQTLGVTPHAAIDRTVDTDLVFSVWAQYGELALDDASVSFIIDRGGNTIFTGSTDDYSVITFGNTLIVHLPSSLNEGNNVLCTYIATITIDDVYTMNGQLLFYGGIEPPSLAIFKSSVR